MRIYRVRSSVYEGRRRVEKATEPTGGGQKYKNEGIVGAVLMEKETPRGRKTEGTRGIYIAREELEKWEQ